jgi:hypothetical protein
MTNEEMKAAMNQMETAFLDSVLHQEGGAITRALLRNVDCQMSGTTCLVFSNKDNKMLVVVLFNENGFVYADSLTFLGRNFPSRKDISTHLMPDIIDWLIRRSVYTVEEKAEMTAYISTWLSQRASDPENEQKIAQYNVLKAELSEKGLI